MRQRKGNNGLNVETYLQHVQGSRRMDDSLEPVPRRLDKLGFILVLAIQKVCGNNVCNCLESHGTHLAVNGFVASTCSF